MRKLNMAFVKDMGKSGSGALVAYFYNEFAGPSIVTATTRVDNNGIAHVTPLGVVAQVITGFAPFVIGSHVGGPFWASFAGAVVYKRLDNINLVLESLRNRVVVETK